MLLTRNKDIFQEITQGSKATGSRTSTAQDQAQGPPEQPNTFAFQEDYDSCRWRQGECNWITGSGNSYSDRRGDDSNRNPRGTESLQRPRYSQPSGQDPEHVRLSSSTQSLCRRCRQARGCCPSVSCDTATQPYRNHAATIRACGATGSEWRCGTPGPAAAPTEAHSGRDS